MAKDRQVPAKQVPQFLGIFRFLKGYDITFQDSIDGLTEMKGGYEFPFWDASTCSEYKWACFKRQGPRAEDVLFLAVRLDPLLVGISFFLSG